MMKQPTVRPARAAIAAVLAFASTPLLAQIAAPTAPPPVAPTQLAPAPVIAAPAAATPAAAVATPATPAPVMPAPSPVVQPTPVPAPVAVGAEPEATVAPNRVSTRTPAPQAAPVRAAAVAASASTEADVSPVSDVAPAAPLASTEAKSAGVDTTTTAPIAGTEANIAAADSNGLEWGLAGGAAVLIAGMGLMAMRRRRRPDTAGAMVVERTEPGSDYASAAPVVEDRPVATEPPFIAPRAASAANTVTGTHGSLEAMVAGAPTAANPFLTRKNRLRRAHFLNRKQENNSPQQAVPTAVAATQVQEQRRASPVYDFGGGATQRRVFRPATT